MTEPKVFLKSPAVIEIEAGEYYWCKCGQSEKQPYCDGSHQGTNFTPVAFKIEEKKKVALCQCKHTAKAPFCDGTHAKL